MKKLTDRESLLRQIGKNGGIKVSLLNQQKRIELAKELEEEGLVKRKKKNKKKDPAICILTEKGLLEYKNKFQK